MRSRIFTGATLRFLLFCAILLSVPSLCLADKAPVSSSNNQATTKTEAVQPGAAKSESGTNLLPPEEVAVPINTEKIDEAGQALGKKIDEVGKGASAKFGRWISAKAFLDITWLKLFVCLGLILLVTAVDRTVRHILTVRLNRATAEKGSRWDILLIRSISKPVSLFIRVYGTYWALSPIWSHFDTPSGLSMVHRAAGKAADMGGMVAFFWFIYQFIQVIDIQVRKWAASTDNSINDMLVPLVSKTVRGFVIVVGGIMVVQNMTGIEIGPLVASLGIGGLAFALAGKDSIANFLGSLTILLDKPFQVGERIIIDKHDGFVEGVGFRSTRLRTLTGNLVSIPNEKIINSPLENIGRRAYLRWNANIGLIYSTSPEMVERAVEIIRQILDNHEGMRADYPPRVYFNAFNDWSLNISVFAWYFPGDFWKYQAWLHRTCIQIMERFRDEGLEMAFPTQTVYQIDQVEQEKPMEVKRSFPARF